MTLHGLHKWSSMLQSTCCHMDCGQPMTYAIPLHARVLTSLPSNCSRGVCTPQTEALPLFGLLHLCAGQGVTEPEEPAKVV